MTKHRHVINDQEIFERVNPSSANTEQEMLDNLVYLTDLNKYRQEQDNISAVLVRVD